MKSITQRFFKRTKIDKKSQVQKLSLEWSKQFIGRKDELQTFRELVEQDDSEKCIIELQGIGGVGKSTLLLQFSVLASSINAKVAIVDHRQKSILDVIQKFVDELQLLGIKFPKYSKKLEKYNELKHETAQDSNKPEQISKWIGENVAELGSLAAKLNPTAELIMQAGGKEAVKQITQGVAEYFYRKFSITDAELMMQPEIHITREFLSDLEDRHPATKVILCFDTYEQTKNIFEQWLLDTLIPQVIKLPNTFLIVSGREVLSENWESYRPMIHEIHLTTFSYEETSSFLAAKGITNPSRIKDFYSSTKGLPLLLQWETINPENLSSSLVKVNRFLNSIPDEKIRESVIICAIPRHFNKDVVKALVRDANAGEIFNLIRKLPGIYEREKYWEFHELIRESILDYKEKESPEEYVEYHHRAFDYYHAKTQLTGRSINAREVKTEALYHLFMIDENKAMEQFLQEFAIAIANFEEWELANLLQTAAQIDLLPENREKIKLLEKSKDSVEKRMFSDALAGLQFLAEITELPMNEKCMILRAIGIIHRNEKRYDQAKNYFEKALELLPDHPQSYEELAKLYLEKNDYEKAIQTYQRLIEKNKSKEISALSAIGLIYLQQSNFEETEKIIARLKIVSPDSIEWLALSAGLKEAQKAWNEAIAIHTDIGETYPQNFIAAQINIARIYILLNDLEMVNNLSRNLIKNHPDDAMGYYIMAFYHRSKGDEENELQMLLEVSKRSALLAAPIINQKAMVALQQGHFDSFLKYYSDFEGVIVDENTLISLGLEWRIGGEDDKALKLFNKILFQNPTSLMAHCNLGDIFWDKGDFEKAIYHFEKAYSLNETLKSAILPLIELYEKTNKSEKALALKKTEIGLEDNEIILFDHSLAGHIHLPKELVDLKHQLVQFEADTADLQTILMHYKLLLLLDMAPEVLKITASATKNVFGRNDLYQELVSSIYSFISNESITEHRRLLKASTRVMVSCKEAFQYLESIVNKNYAIVAERYWNTGMIANATGQIELAEDCFLRAKQIFPELPQTKIELGLLYLNKGKEESALLEFQELISNAHQQQTSILIGRLIILNQFEVVEKIAGSEPQIQEHLVEIYGNVGVNLLNQGAFAKAEQCFSKIIDIDPSVERAYIDLANVYQIENRKDQCILILNKLLLVNPNSTEAKQKLLAIQSETAGNKSISSSDGYQGL